MGAGIDPEGIILTFPQLGSMMIVVVVPATWSGRVSFGLGCISDKIMFHFHQATIAGIGAAKVHSILQYQLVSAI